MENPILSPPPRSLSLLSRLIILTRGTVQQMGWFFLCFGMIFFWVFFMNSEARYWFEWTSWEAQQGEITAISATSSYVNEQRVMEYTYRYTWDGEVSLGSGFGPAGMYQTGANCPIEVNPSDGLESRLVGARRATFPAWAAFVVLFPLIGLGMILYAFRQNFKRIDLLRYGLLAKGTLIEKEKTGAEINNSPVYRYTFSFKAIDGKTYQVKGDTHLAHLLEDDLLERLLYAKADPTYAVLFDTIRPSIHILPGGQYQALSLFQGAGLILPLLTLLIHGTIAWIFYML